MAKRKSVIINGTETCKSGGNWPGSSYNNAWTSDVNSNGNHVELNSNGNTNNNNDGNNNARFAVFW